MKDKRTLSGSDENSLVLLKKTKKQKQKGCVTLDCERSHKEKIFLYICIFPRLRVDWTER